MLMPFRRKKRRVLARKRRLTLDVLESRRLLAGDVTAAYDDVTDTLTITGDANANGVEIVAGPNPGEYLVQGTDVSGVTKVVGDTFIHDPISAVVIDLMAGSDEFSFAGADAANQLEITGSVTITDPSGNNEFEIINTRVTGDVTVTGGTDEDSLQIGGSTIIGDTAFTGGTGQSTVIIEDGSILDGDLQVTNGGADDGVFVYGAEIDGNFVVNNGDGNNTVVLGLNESPVVGGEIEITQGADNDTVIIHETEVLNTVTIQGGDGNNQVIIEGSNFGISTTGTILDIDNGVGRDILSISEDTTIADNINIRNGAPADTSGSETMISDSTLRGDFNFDGDNGVDEFSVISTQIVNDVDLDLFGGASFVVFMNSDLGDDLFIDGGANRDNITISGTIVENDVTINLMDGKDTLQLDSGTQLLGITSLEGGAHPDDTLIRELTPDAVDIAFLALESFELDEFLTF